MYRQDESKEITIQWLEAKLVDLKREIRTIENAIDYLSKDKQSEKKELDGLDIPYPAGHNWEGLTPKQVNEAYEREKEKNNETRKN